MKDTRESFPEIIRLWFTEVVLLVSLKENSKINSRIDEMLDSVAIQIGVFAVVM